MTNFFKKNIFWVTVLIIFGAIFRLSNMDLIEFKSDEATIVYQTVNFFDQPYLISRGIISGTGVYNFPLFNYLIIILSTGSRDPQILSGTIALINSLLIGAFFLFVRKFYNFTIAILASLLLATSPWAVLFSRKIWAQDLILLLLIPILWLLHEIILRRNNKFKVVLPFMLLLTLLVQLHASGLFFFIATLIILLIWRIRLNFLATVLGILIGLIPAMPYFLFQVTSNPICPDCTALLQYQNSFRQFDFLNLLRPFQSISGLGFYFILDKNYAEFVNLYPISQLKYIFATAILIILAGFTGIIGKQRKYFFLLIYFVVIPIIFLISRTPSYMHYFVPLLPISIIIFTVPISFLINQQSKVLRIIAVAFFSVFIISNIIFLTSFYQFLDWKKEIEGDYGSVFSVTEAFINQQINKYKKLSYYDQLRSFAYIHAHADDFHNKLGEFFLMRGDEELARKEVEYE